MTEAEEKLIASYNDLVKSMPLSERILSSLTTIEHEFLIAVPFTSDGVTVDLHSLGITGTIVYRDSNELLLGISLQEAAIATLAGFKAYDRRETIRIVSAVDAMNKDTSSRRI
jgi:hypothetical protein